VFIILFIYVVAGVVIEKVGGTQGALRLLISVTLYAFIVFQGFYTFFVSLSKVWWILLASIVGLWIFIRKFIHSGGGGGGTFVGAGGSGRGMSGMIKEAKQRWTPELNKYILDKASGYEKGIKTEISALERLVEEYSDMTPRDQKEFVKTIHRQENVVKVAIDRLDDYTNENKGLKRKYDKIIDNYRAELNLLQKREKLEEAA